MTESPLFEPADYLGSVLPTLIARAAPAFDTPKTVQFFVEGDIVCYLVMGADGVESHTGRHDQPDLSIAITPEDLAALSQGDLQAEEALGEGRLRVVGDEQLLLTIAGCLSQ